MIEQNDIENPFRSIENCLAFHVRDWASEKRDAWLWAVVWGWEGDAMKEVAEKHNWDAETVDRLKRLHRRWKAIREASAE